MGRIKELLCKVRGFHDLGEGNKCQVCGKETFRANEKIRMTIFNIETKPITTVGYDFIKNIEAQGRTCKK